MWACHRGLLVMAALLSSSAQEVGGEGTGIAVSIGLVEMAEGVGGGRLGRVRLTLALEEVPY